MIQNFFEKFVFKYPKIIILFIVLVTIIISITLLPDIKTNPTADLLPEGHPSKLSLDNLRDTFTGTKPRVVLLFEANDTIYKDTTLKRIKKISEEIESITVVLKEDLNSLKKAAKNVTGKSKDLINGLLKNANSLSVQFIDEIKINLEKSNQMTPKLQAAVETINIHLNPIVKLSSISNTDNILGQEDELIIKLIYEDVPETDGEIEKLKTELIDNQLFKDLFFTDNEKFTGIFLEINLELDDSKAIYEMYLKLKEILDKNPGDEKYYIAGYPSTVAHISTVMDKDMAKLFPIVILIILFTLGILFRKPQGIFIPLLVVILTIIFTFVLKVLFKVPLNIVSTTIPVFLISIGVADGVHVVSEFLDQRRAGKNSYDSIKETMEILYIPVIMTSITTACGFFALAATKVVQIRHFGIFVGTGTILAMFFSLIVIPAILLLFPAKKIKIQEKKSHDFIGVILKNITLFVLKYSYLILTILIIIMGLSLFSIITRIYVDNNGVLYFKKNSEVVISSNTFNTHFAGTDELNIILTLDDKNGTFKETDNLKVLENIQQFVSKDKIVGKTLSLADLIKRMNYVLHENDPQFDRLPATFELNEEGEKIQGKTLVSQYLLLYEMSGGDLLSDFADYDYKKTTIRIVLRTNSSHKVGKLIEKIDEYVKESIPANMSVDMAGLSENNVAMNKEIVISQVQSLGISFVLILLLLLFIFRSFIKGILGLLPLVSTILINFGIMGLLRIPLDIGTAIINSITIGVGVDYSIHYLSRLQKELDKGLPYQEAMLITINNSGKAILFNATVVGLGFLALLFSDFLPINTVGWMVSMTMFICCIVTLVIIPSFLHVFKPRFLKINN